MKNYILYNEKQVEYRKRIMSVLHKLTNGRIFSEDEREEFINIGWEGVWKAMKSYDPEKRGKNGTSAQFETYATECIKYELKDELRKRYPRSEMGNVSFDYENTGLKNRLGEYDEYDEYNDAENGEQYPEEKLALLVKAYNEEASMLKLTDSHRQPLQLLRILMKDTDEEHALTVEDLDNKLTKCSGKEKEKKNDTRTTSKILKALAFEMEGRIAYDVNEKGSRTNYRYVHPFSNDELDHIIESVVFSGSIPKDEKERLIGGLAELSSSYYETVFYNRSKKKLETNNNTIFTRTCGLDVSKNIKAVQEAINNDQRITFKYNYYSADKKLVPCDRSYELSPHQIVIYHDMYYLIGSREGSSRPAHYRIDLMSEITPATDDSGKIKKRESMASFTELRDKMSKWQPDKYMSEHLYMDFDRPRMILIKIRNDQYRVLHDWFGDYFEKSFKKCEDEGWDYVNITTSPKMIVYWAMQYSDIVEVMDKEVREKIKEEAARLAGKYGSA